MVKVKLFPKNPHEDAARALYERIVTQSRSPVFYRDYGVPDSVDGRFEMLLLHAFLVFHRLRGEGEEAKRLGQTLFDLLVFHLDQSVRISGVGDLGAGRKMKAMEVPLPERNLVVEWVTRSAPQSTGRQSTGVAMDCGDNVVVINAEKVRLTGRKLADKQYYWHTGYPGGIKSRTAGQIIGGSHPERIILKAVERMVVSLSCIGGISPKPLKRLISTFFLRSNSSSNSVSLWASSRA